MSTAFEELVKTLPQAERLDLLVGREKRLRAEIGRKRKETHSVLWPVVTNLGYESLSTFTSTETEALDSGRKLYRELVELSDALEQTLAMLRRVKNEQG